MKNWRVLAKRGKAMIDTVDWQLAEASGQARRRKIQKRNRAFRLQLEQARQRRREVLKLKLVCVLAFASWAFAAFRFLAGGG